MSLVAWPSNESKTGVDLVFMETSLLNPHVNDAVLVLISMNLCRKSSEVSIKATCQLQPHFHSKAR